MISLAHAPNSTPRQRRLALSWLLPWRWSRWQQGPHIAELEQTFASFHHVPDAVTFASGRQALYAILNALNITAGDEIILQAYTCMVVPQAIVWCGALPIYGDIDETGNLSTAQVRKLITQKTKAVIVQHAFGVPADLEKISALCKEKNLLLIEDCAHALGAKSNGQRVGTIGDAALFSFGRDKIISSTAGGLAIAQNPTVAARLRSLAQKSPCPSKTNILQNILHPLLIPLCRSTLAFGGTVLLRAFQSLGLLNKVYTAQEMQGTRPVELTKRLPNALAALALDQFTTDLPAFEIHRRQHVAAYETWARKQKIQYQQARTNDTSAALRFTIFVENPQKIRHLAKKQGFILGDWYKSVIMPEPQNMRDLAYQPGSCPKAEQAAAQSLNLPTHIGFTATDRTRLLTWLETVL